MAGLDGEKGWLTPTGNCSPLTPARSPATRPWPTPTHMVASALAAALHHLMRRRDGKPRARHAERMAERDGAAVGLTCSASSGRPSWRRQASACEANAFVELDHVEIADLEPGAAISLRVDGTGPMPMTRGGTPADGHAEDARVGREAVLLRRRFRGDDHGGGAVVDAGRIARRDRAGIAHERLELGGPPAWSRAAGARPVDRDRPGLAGPARRPA